jgi:hypothetical protein
MIPIKQSKTADTRTCDFANVTKQTLLESSVQHIDDVRRGLECFGTLLNLASRSLAHPRDRHRPGSAVAYFLAHSSVTVERRSPQSVAPSVAARWRAADGPAAHDTGLRRLDGAHARMGPRRHR